MTKDQKAVFSETCETLIDNGGVCLAVDCDDCPFSLRYHEHDDCEVLNTALVESAKQWLKDNPAVSKEELQKPNVDLLKANLSFETNCALEAYGTSICEHICDCPRCICYIGNRDELEKHVGRSVL